MCPACVSTAVMIATGVATMSGVVATVWKKSGGHDAPDATAAGTRPEHVVAGPHLEVER